MEIRQPLDVVAIISATIALFSAIFAFWQAMMAKKSYKLQKRMYEEGKVKFELQWIENSFLYNSKSENKIYYFFKIILANLSDKPTAITKISLKLLHDNNLSFIVSCKNSTNIQPDLSRLIIPNNIAPHNSNLGWIVFEIERKIYETININTHIILAEDIHGITAEKEEIYVREKIVGYDF
ncbi:hypothetical protein [Clostridium saccharoperbutylacetonicum]|uniref:hypothetical protein n=1 Tax=Clostridium saccharoperbutylacetonicum TaxID=36745 RepID=UPI0039ECAD80